MFITLKAHQIAAPTDETFVNAVANHLRQCALNYEGLAHMYIETAGGELSNIS